VKQFGGKKYRGTIPLFIKIEWVLLRRTISAIYTNGYKGKSKIRGQKHDSVHINLPAFPISFYRPLSSSPLCIHIYIFSVVFSAGFPYTSFTLHLAGRHKILYLTKVGGGGGGQKKIHKSPVFFLKY
jgi:hypothetical protein